MKHAKTKSELHALLAEKESARHAVGKECLRLQRKLGAKNDLVIALKDLAERLLEEAWGIMFKIQKMDEECKAQEQ